MSDPEPIDLSQLQNLNLAPDWVGDLQKRETAPGEVVWGRAPDHERESRGGGQGQGYGGGGGGGGRGGPRREGGRPDFNRPGGGPPRGPRQDDRGPRPAGPGGFGGPGGPPRGPRQDDRGPRPSGPGGPRPAGPGGPRQDRPPGDRPQGDRGPRPSGGGGGSGGGRFEDRNGPRGGGGGGERRGGPHPDFRGGDRRGGPHGRFDDRPHIEPLPGWRVRLFAEPKSLEAIVRQIKASGRAYPVFEMGRLFLAGRDRYLVNFSRQQTQPPQQVPKGTPQPEAPPMGGPDELFHVPADGSLWTSRDEAIRHLLNGPGIQDYYSKETISIDPPKGIFTAVAVCGFSGTILGPPNHHSFQTTVARLHREQFYNLPIDRYKSRIRTEKDEALVAKWLEEQSTTTVFVPRTASEIAAARAAREATPKVPNPAKATTPSDPSATESQDDPATAGDAPETAAASPQPHEPEAVASIAPENIQVAPEATEAAPGTAEASAATSESGNNESAPSEPGSPPESPAESTATAAVEEPAAAAEPPQIPLKTQSAMEAHFIEHHAPTAVVAVTRISVSGNIPGKLLAPPLLALLRLEVEQQQRFPMQLVQDLCRDLEKESLKFFKRDKKATFVCRTRPHFIEDESHLSPRLRSIVGVVKANPGITVPKLVSTLAPHIEKVAPEAVTPPPPSAEPASTVVPLESAPNAGEAVHEDATTPVPIAASASAEVVTTTEPVDRLTEIPSSPEPPPVAESARPTVAVEKSESADSPPADDATNPAESSGAPPSDAPAPEAPAAGPSTPDSSVTGPTGPTKEARRPEDDRQRRPKGQKGPKGPPAPPAPPAPLTAEEIGVLQDLRWLVQEGFVTEYASGELQILGRPPQPPAEKKPKAEPKSAPASAEGASLTSPSGGETSVSPSGESAVPADPEAKDSGDSIAVTGVSISPEVVTDAVSSPEAAELSGGSSDSGS